MEQTRQPRRWERQPGEPPKAFATFCAYRNLHPLDRSLAVVGQKLGVSKSYLERLSAKFQWVDRAAAFDREQDRLDQARRVREVQAMNERHATIAASILQKIALYLEGMDATSLRPSEVARLLEVATRAERMGRGVPPDDPAVQQSGMAFNADEIRRQLKAEGLLPDPAAGRTPVAVPPPAHRS